MTVSARNLPALKTVARRAAAARREAAHATLGPAPEAATAALLAALSGDPAAVVSGYLPIRSEIDPRPAMAGLVAEGRRVCVPVIVGAGLPLSFREWRPGAALIPGPFGALVPAAGDPLEPEALIVPLLAFDAAGTRLGYGGGFYDRTLASLPGARAAGVAYAAQAAPEPLPSAATDRPLALIVTEAGAFRPPPDPRAAPAPGGRPA